MHDAAASSCDRAAWDFARVEEAWAEYRPLTPLGKDAREARLVLSDRAAIERAYDATEAAAEALARMGAERSDRLAYHLARVPRLPRLDGERLGAVDLFLVKKFIANYRAALGLLDDRAKAAFGLGFESEALAELLDQGGSDPESFYVSDSLDAGLGPVRALIVKEDESIRAFRAADREAARTALGVDFGQREFIVMSVEDARELSARRAALALGGAGSSPLFSVEALDSLSCVVRIESSEGELRARAERSRLGAAERELEEAVIARLGREAAREAGRLEGCADALRDFDLARARALMAARLGFTRPRLGSTSLVIEGGRFLPCERERAELGARYESLDLDLSERGALIFGSNMGGKTVALRTVIFLQILAQAGLFVPARRFETEVYPRILYVGEEEAAARVSPPRREDGDGLSGFGREVAALSGAVAAARSGGALAALDELGRTTSSPEAEALLSAALEAALPLEGSRFLFATHFRGVARLPGAAYLRMLGLDREAAAARMEAAGADATKDERERLRMLGSLMRYRVAREGGAAEGSGDSDAIAVASILGLDRGIVEAARRFYAARRGAIG
jgi:DNA mismatch repair protein MutS2